MLLVLGVITIASGAAGSVGAGSDNWLLGLVGISISIVLNAVPFLLAFRILTTENVSWVMGRRPTRRTGRRPAWTALQAIGGYYVSHELQVPPGRTAPSGPTSGCWHGSASVRGRC
jgi:hypothetical protein